MVGVATISQGQKKDRDFTSGNGSSCVTRMLMNIAAPTIRLLPLFLPIVRNIYRGNPYPQIGEGLRFTNYR